jgi:hypothetical protein
MIAIHQYNELAQAIGTNIASEVYKVAEKILNPKPKT